MNVALILSANVRHLYLTNRFHFAVCLFSYRSQMTSKCSKDKKVAHFVPKANVPFERHSLRQIS